MKNRTNVIIELTVLLVLCIGVALVISTTAEEDPATALGITPLYSDENGVTVWAFDEEMNELLEENLQAPVRAKYGMDEPEDAFSRCSSYVSTYLSGDTGEIYKDGFYYASMNISMGCETVENYGFRVDSMGTVFEIEDSTGTYVSVEEWVKTE